MLRALEQRIFAMRRERERLEGMITALEGIRTEMAGLIRKRNRPAKPAAKVPEAETKQVA
jgi:hypothetical protein